MNPHLPDSANPTLADKNADLPPFKRVPYTAGIWLVSYAVDWICGLAGPLLGLYSLEWFHPVVGLVLVLGSFIARRFATVAYKKTISAKLAPSVDNGAQVKGQAAELLKSVFITRRVYSQFRISVWILIVGSLMMAFRFLGDETTKLVAFIAAFIGCVWLPVGISLLTHVRQLHDLDNQLEGLVANPSPESIAAIAGKYDLILQRGIPINPRATKVMEDDWKFKAKRLNLN